MCSLKLLDLCCGYGGASVGYARAGFEVVGVDTQWLPTYPFKYLHRDCRKVLQDIDYIQQFDVIHASPPCQEHTRASALRVAQGNKIRKGSESILTEVRELLVASGKPYIIENVSGAPLVTPVQLCGTSFDLHIIRDGIRRDLQRHRLFESNIPLVGSTCYHYYRPLGVYGGMGDSIPGGGQTVDSLEEAKQLMGIDWISYWSEKKEAIPPVYTEYLGNQLVAILSNSQFA